MTVDQFTYYRRLLEAIEVGDVDPNDHQEAADSKTRHMATLLTKAFPGAKWLPFLNLGINPGHIGMILPMRPVWFKDREIQIKFNRLHVSGASYGRRIVHPWLTAEYHGDVEGIDRSSNGSDDTDPTDDMRDFMSEIDGDTAILNAVKSVLREYGLPDHDVRWETSESFSWGTTEFSSVSCMEFMKHLADIAKGRKTAWK